MASAPLRPGRLERKVLAIVSVIVVVPMLVAGWVASEWVSRTFEERLEKWIVDAARASQLALESHQKDAAALGRVLAADPGFRESLADPANPRIPPAVRQMAEELRVDLIQIYGPGRTLLYSTLPVKFLTFWVDEHSEAVLKAVRDGTHLIAAVGITPISPGGGTSYQLVLGSLLARDFTAKLQASTGMRVRLYHREGENYFDLYAYPDAINTLRHLSRRELHRLEQAKTPLYRPQALDGQFRGLYTPILDSSGHVEAILFTGLERRGATEVLTNRLALFAAIALLGLVIGGLAGLLLSRLVLRPLTALRAGVLAVAGQNFDAEVRVRSDDELGDLGRAFNAMAARLREARDAQAQQFLRDKLAALGELSATLAHEIRNPIGVISTSAALLERPDTNPEKRERLLGMIREESRRVATLMQDFLQLSRFRAPVPARIDPFEPLERALRATLASSGDIAIRRDCPAAGTAVVADADQLHQAWANLVQNAVQAMAGGGTLTAECRIEDGRVAVTLEDSGPGLPSDIVPRLFEPFFTTKPQGTGLGLTVAHALVTANGGQLMAEAPRHGNGARFTMRFPQPEEHPA